MKKDIIRLLGFLPKRTAHKLFYRMIMNKKLNLRNPKGFNEKLHYLIVNEYGEHEGLLSDKYKVKSIIAKKRIKNLYIPRTLKVYHSVDDIRVEELPEKFVLKCNHGSGSVFICRDKNHFDLENAKRELKKSLNQDFSKVMLEYHYSFIDPVIIAEEYLDDSNSLYSVDYKFYCFNGVPKYLYVSEGLEDHRTAKMEFFDMEFKPAPFGRSDYLKFGRKLQRPENFEEMKEIARKLSKGEKFVRVDLYNINGKIYFGELTFSPCAGVMMFEPPEWDQKLGGMLDLGIDRNT